MTNRQDWALKLFKKSPLKQKKYQMLLKFIEDDDRNANCLDIGSDNGVISLLFREKGQNVKSTWTSADLIPETVESIRSLVKDRVFEINDLNVPFKDHEFDLIVVIDFLEHIKNDHKFILEMLRILKPNGTLIINVPNPVEGIMRKIKFKIGQTDAAHGHLRSGYSLEELKMLLGDKFAIIKEERYSRFFSDFIDTSLTFAMDKLKGKRGQKGTVVTGEDLKKFEKSFKLYSLIYPFVAMFVKMDDIFSFLPFR